nr:CCA tRNA nucleotidyltransferase [Thermoleophilaceae bacterium]
MSGPPGDLVARLRALPGMSLLLPALDGLAPAHLVGGAVRDLLRGERSVDLDLCTEH